MPFVFFNASVGFQGYINQILPEKLDVFVIIYLNDIGIYTDKTDHIDVVWWVLNVL